MADSIALLLLIVSLELVLGVDNILVISIFVGRLPESHRNRARVLGLALALVARVVMLFILLRLTSLTNPVLFHLSAKDLILLSGGLFLLWKAVKEIHHTVEFKEEEHPAQARSQSIHLSAHGICFVCRNASVEV